MKTEDLKAKGLTQEQIDFVMAENGKDITGLKTAQSELETAKTTISTLETEKATLQTTLQNTQAKLDGFKDVNVDDLKGQIATLTTDLQTERDNAKKAESKHALEKNVSDFLQDKQFVNEFTKKSIVNSLMDELDKDSAKGKSISDIFNSIVNGEDGKPLPNILVDTNSQNNAAKFTNPQLGIPAAGTKLSGAELMKLKNQYPDLDITQFI